MTETNFKIKPMVHEGSGSFQEFVNGVTLRGINEWLIWD